MKYIVGCAVFLKHIPIRSIFFNLELEEGRGATVARSAGTSCLLLSSNHTTNMSVVRIPSGKRMVISSYCVIVLGKNHNR
jgi:large subunit ribosomal protein L2